MELKTKKILAREFLILTTTLVLGLIAFLCIYPYNFIRQNQVDNKTTEIKAKAKFADSLISIYHSKCKNQNWFFNKYDAEYDIANDTEVNSSEKWWELFEYHAKKDSLIIRWKTRWDKELIDYLNKIGFDTPTKLNEFILKNSINNTDLTNKDSAKRVYSEIKELKNNKASIESKILDSNEQINIGIWTLIISAFLLFVLRYILYAVKWSIKTLRQKSDLNNPK